MKRRMVMIAVIVAVLLVVAAAMPLRHLSQQARTQRIESAVRLLDNDDPLRRIEAARLILDLDAGRDAVRIMLVEALIHTGQHEPARDALARLDQPGRDRYVTARILRTRSYLEEATDIIARTTPTRIKLIREYVEQLLNHADPLIKELATVPGHEPLVALFEARRFDIRADLLRVQLRALTARLAKAQAIDHVTVIEDIELEVARLRDQIRAINARLVPACHKAIELDSDTAEPLVMLFDMHLHDGAIAEARSAAEQLTAMQRLSGAAAGRVADTLLQLEPRYALETTAVDIDLARRLVGHPRLDRQGYLGLRLAKLALLVHDEHLGQAEQLANNILTSHPEHPRAGCLLARVLIRDDRAEEAVKLLHGFEKRMRRAEVELVLGSALLATGRYTVGLSMLRQCLDRQPGNLSAHLQIARSKIGQGRLLEAEPDIHSAIRINRKHSAVKMLRAMWLIERFDRDGLIAMLNERVGSGHAVSAADLSLAAAMAIDDVDDVTRRCHAPRGGDWGDDLWVIADYWCRAKPLARLAVTDAVVGVLAWQLNADPMAAAEPPEAFTGLTKPSDGDTADAAHQVARVLLESRFIHPSHAIAMSIVEQGLQRWPDDKALAQTAAQMRLWRNWPPHTKLSDNADALSRQGPTAQLLEIIDALQRRDDTAVDDALRRLLDEHHWSQAAVLMVIADAAAQRRRDRVESVLATVAQTHNGLALLAGARWDLADGRPRDAMAKLDAISDDDAVAAATLHRLTADIHARAGITLGRHEFAEAVFETFPTTEPSRDHQMHMAAVDLLIDIGKNDNAASSLMVLINNSQTPAYWLDLAMARAERILTDDQWSTLVGQMSPLLAQRPIVVVYRARALCRAGQVDQAEQMATRLARGWPDSPRVLMLTAELAAERGRTGQLLSICQRLIDLGGATEAAARRLLDRIDAGRTHIEDTREKTVRR